MCFPKWFIKQSCLLALDEKDLSQFISKMGSSTRSNNNNNNQSNTSKRNASSLNGK